MCTPTISARRRRLLGFARRRPSFEMTWLSLRKRLLVTKLLEEERDTLRDKLAGREAELEELRKSCNDHKGEKDKLVE